VSFCSAIQVQRALSRRTAGQSACLLSEAAQMFRAERAQAKTPETTEEEVRALAAVGGESLPTETTLKLFCVQCFLLKVGNDLNDVCF